MPTAPARQRREHLFDGGELSVSQGMDRLGSRGSGDGNWKKKREPVDDGYEDEQPLCVVRSVKRNEAAASTTSAPAGWRGNVGSGGGSSVIESRVEGEVSGGWKEVAVGSVEKKRGLGEGRRTVEGAELGASSSPVTKRFKSSSARGNMEAWKRKTDPEDEDEDHVPLAMRKLGKAKTSRTALTVSPDPEPTASTIADPKRVMDARKARLEVKTEGLAGMANLSSNGTACTPKLSTARPAMKEAQGWILNQVPSGKNLKALERKTVLKAVSPILMARNFVPDSDDSDDDKPLSYRKSMTVIGSREAKPDLTRELIKKRSAVQTSPSSNLRAVKKLKVLPNVQPPCKPSLQSVKSVCLVTPKSAVPRDPDSTPKAMAKREVDPDDEDDNMPLAERISSLSSASRTTTTVKTLVSAPVKEERGRDDDHVPVGKRLLPSTDAKSKVVTVVKRPSAGSAKSITKKVLEQRRKGKNSVAITKKLVKGKCGGSGGKMTESGGTQKWVTLEHNGVIFPPPYQPHGVNVLYRGKPVGLTSEQEEVATMFAVMKDTDYAAKPKFIENFWTDWKEILGAQHIIQDFEHCDFTPIHEWQQTEKEKKKSISTEDKKRLKAEKLKMEDKYMWALVNGVKEKVGNFRVEPPGLFRGRGEHPKMGKLKTRIYPENIVINIGKGAPVPECPMPGHRWKEVRHDNTVTWLAFWNDPINNKEFKYVFLAASSSLKGQSDMEKYEKARTLKDHIGNIRRTYTKNFSSSDPVARQIAVATYLIDRLALRAGNEKDEDEADTVGCCSLKVEHVLLVPPKSLTFDFLGKDSIRYFNTVEVEEKVYTAIGDFKRGKEQGKDLFDKLDTTKLNAHLKGIMPALTAKVFRTFNASVTLDRLLQDTVGSTVAEMVADYQRANKEVAILCNHQRTVSKSHSSQMERLEAKMAEAQELVAELKIDMERARRGKPPLKDVDGKPKRVLSSDSLRKKIAQTEQKVEKMKLEMKIKDDMKTIALGTSKINYMDPRISVAWCKRHEVPIEKVFNKSLLAKFSWAMDVDPDYRF